MTDLRFFFNPRSIAIIGASQDPTVISGRPLRILQQHGYGGAVYPVNPKYSELRGVAVYPSIGSVPAAVDLALVAVPAPSVVGVLEECAAAGVRYAMVFSSGFGEIGAEGQARQAAIRALVGRTGLRVCGPNCEGFFNVADGVPAAFSPAVDPDRSFHGTRAGSIGIVSQSGGQGFALYERGLEQGLGFSTIISTGNEVDLEALDYVEYMVEDERTRVILAFIESFKNGRRLAEVACKAAVARKPLIVVKIGRSEAARRAAVSHTGSLVGSDEAYSAAFRQYGVIRVDDGEEMIDLAAYFSFGRLPAGRRVAILTASGGGGGWLADACAAQGLELPEPEAEIREEIASFIPVYGSTANPIDVTAQVTGHGGLERTLGLLNRSEQFDSIVVITTLGADQNFRKFLPELRKTAAATKKALLYYSYTTPKPNSLQDLRDMSIPCFTTPVRTARALAHACRYAEFLGRPPSALAPSEEARATVLDARVLLAPAAIPAPAEGLARSPEEAAALFREIDGPVALKIQSPDLPHKTDVGGVRLGLDDAGAVRAAYVAMVATVRAHAPEADIQGVLVQQMVSDGVEIILGARVDPDFGPLVMVGLGGIFVEVLRDVALRLAPVSADEARAMIEDLRGADLLRGVRGRPPADLAALAEAIGRFSEVAARLPAGVAAIEINPLLVRPEGRGVMMVDLRLELSEEAGR